MQDTTESQVKHFMVAQLDRWWYSASVNNHRMVKHFRVRFIACSCGWHGIAVIISLDIFHHRTKYQFSSHKKIMYYILHLWNRFSKQIRFYNHNQFSPFFWWIGLNSNLCLYFHALSSLLNNIPTPEYCALTVVQCMQVHVSLLTEVNRPVPGLPWLAARQDVWTDLLFTNHCK